MSLHPRPLPPVPEATARVAQRAFRRGNPYLTLRDRLGAIFVDADFLSLYGHRGAPATSPAVLALVTVLQYMEHLTDIQAADAVRSRVDWKYLLGLPLEDDGFDASTLSEFRARLVEGGAVDSLLDRVLARLQEDGLLRTRGRARTDSTRVLASVALLNRLELVGETMRHALNSLADHAPAWLRAHSDPAWVDRYGPRLAASRLPAKPTERDTLFRQIGQDGFALLAAVDAPETPRTVQEDQGIDVLRQVWAQQYRQSDDGPRLRPGPELDPAATLVRSPYDPEARWSVKRETEWTGYTVHLTETCEPQAVRLITAVETTPATVPDERALDPIQAQLARRGLLPARHLLDAGYLTGPELVRRQRDQRVTLVGPMPPDTSWQARAGAGYAAAAFTLDWESQVATCPAGKRSSTWRPKTSERGQPVIEVHFRMADCGPCPVRLQCTRADRRSLKLRPRAEHEAIQGARARQQTTAFKQEYAKRAGIEGTISQAVRRSGLRRTRYRGIAKTHLQHVATALALNLTRLALWFEGTPDQPPRRSPFARLMATPACP